MGPSEHFSPLRYFYQFLPPRDDKALRQAVYNTLTLAFLVVFAAALVAVYFILEAFLRPLIWALLIGSCLHPIKSKLSSTLKQWIQTTQTSSRPLFVEATIFPLKTINRLLDFVYDKTILHLKYIMTLLIVVPCLYLILHLVPIKTHFEIFLSIWKSLATFLSYFSTTWLLLGIILYLSLVVFYWTPESYTPLKLLSLPVWLGVIFYCSSLTGVLGVPLFIFFIFLICLGGAVEIRASIASCAGSTWQFISNLRANAVGAGSSEEASVTNNSSLADASSEQFESELSDIDIDSLSTTPEIPSAEATTAVDQSIDNKESTVAKDATDKASSNSGSSNSGADQSGTGNASAAGNNSAGQSGTGNASAAGNNSAGQSRQSNRSQRRVSRRIRSRTFFILLFWAHAAAYAWSNLWVLSLLPICAIVLIIRTVGDGIGGSEFVTRWANCAKEKLKKLIKERQDALAPLPVRGVYKLLLRGDEKLADILNSSIDTIVSIFLILLVLTASVFIAIFLVIQVQRESIELITMTSSLLNNTVMTASSSILPQKDNLQKILDSMLSKAYVFGREWLSYKINTVFDTNEYNKAKIEEQVLQLWDRLYEKLAAKNFTWSPLWSVSGKGGGDNNTNNTMNITLPTDRFIGIERQASIQVSGSVYELMTVLLDTSKIISFVKENLGVLTQVMESLWIVIKGNLNLMTTLLTTILSVAFGGGTAVLNFLLQTLVFLTSLYLLLCFSGEMYLPVQFIASLSSSKQHNPVLNALYSAVNDATSGVFLASMKIACFYGLYTNLVHSTFSVNLVFMPSVLAAVFGAVPFLGTYWACLPGVLELWLMQEHVALAVIFAVLHVLPTYMVDTTIYGEIRGAGHPYLTGLSVAGGLYWYGLEGAIFGPILLACLLVAVNVYSILLSPHEPRRQPLDHQSSDPQQQHQQQTRQQQRQQTMRRSISVYQH